MGIRSVARIRGVLAGAVLSAACGSASPPPPPPADATVTISAAESIDARNIVGMLHGVTYDSAKDYRDVIERLQALHLRRWRLSSYSNDVGAFVARGDFVSGGTQIVFNVQDMYELKQGTTGNTYLAEGLGGTCATVEMDPTEGGVCFETFADLRAAWRDAITTFMTVYAAHSEYVIHRWDIFSEPDWQFLGTTPEELFVLFQDAYSIIRGQVPDALIGGPSIGRYRADVIRQFVQETSAAGIDIADLHWHEFETEPDGSAASPSIVVDHVAEARSALEELGHCAAGTCPDIYIAEYGSPDTAFIPGWEVAWLHYLTAAHADAISKACWSYPRTAGRPANWNSCWDTFGGLLYDDLGTPQPLYWVHEAYARIAAAQVATSTTDPRVVAVAGHDGPRLVVIVGSHHAEGTQRIDVSISGLMERTRYQAVLTRIPDTDNLPMPFPSPEPLSNREVVGEPEVHLFIDEVAAGDAIIIELTPAS